MTFQLEKSSKEKLSAANGHTESMWAAKKIEKLQDQKSEKDLFHTRILP